MVVVMWILGLLLALGALVLAIAVTAVIVRALIELTIRVGLAAGLAVAFGGAAGLAATQWDGDGLAIGFVAALLAFVPALVVVSKWRTSSGQRAERTAPALASALAPVKTCPEPPIERSLGLADGEKLAAAWNDAQRMAPRDPLEKEREACARFLASFEADADRDPAAIDLATFIRRHVPGLVSETRIVAGGAEETERAEAIAAMVAGLRQVGHDAQEMLTNRHREAQTRLAIRRQRFAIRRAEQGGWR